MIHQNDIPNIRCIKSFLEYEADGLITKVALNGREKVSVILRALVTLAPILTIENDFLLAPGSKFVAP